MDNASDFVIENGILKKYSGSGGDVVIPDGVTGIASCAFMQARRITSVIIPEGVTSIGYRAFQYVNAAKIVIPNSVKKIDAEAFAGCRSLQSIVIPDSVTKISRRAFAECRSLTSVVIPNRVTTIDKEAFAECRNLASITIPERVRTIGIRAFSGCSSLANLTIPKHVTSIGSEAFSGCQSLKSIVLPKQVTDIGEQAFSYCHSLNHIVLPETVMDSIDSKWLHSRFFDVDVNSVWLEGNTNFDSRVGEICKKSILRRKDEYIQKIIQNDSAQAMANFLPLLTKVSIDLLDHYLAQSMDSQASAVTAVLLDYKAECFTTEDAEQAATEKFDKALGLKEYTVSDWRKVFKFSIKDGKVEITAYKGAEKSVTIPAKIGKNAVTSFCLCAPKNNREIYNQAACEQITDVIIEDGIETIGENAFCGCNSLRNIEIPSSVTRIAQKAFKGCRSLTCIEIPDSVTRIGEEAFQDCVSLTSIQLPGHVGIIGERAFMNCSGLTSVQLPRVYRIRDGVFCECRSLSSIEIPDSVTSIGNETFAKCSKLRIIIIPESVCSIGDNSFVGCHKLVVHAPIGSYAHTYAKKHNIRREE